MAATEVRVPRKLIQQMIKLIQQMIKDRKGSMVIMFDACRSGSSAVDLNRLSSELNDLSRGAMVYTSSTAKLPSFEREDWQNGAFTKALIEGLSGKADPYNKGLITSNTLAEYVRVRVEELTETAQNTVFPAGYGFRDDPRQTEAQNRTGLSS
jgi:uncharacterized caspase-like protein